MLDSIKQLFIKETKQPVSSQEELVDFDTNPRFLRSHAQKVRLLQQLHDKNALLTISIEGVTENFASTILTIRPSESYLLLDELNIPAGHQQLLSKGKCKVQASLNGVDAIFKIDSFKTGESNGIAYYKVPLPDEIYYPQKRNSRRISLTSGYPIPFHATIPSANAPLLGHLQNISATGIGALVSNRLPCRRGDTLTNCKIPLPDGEEIQFDLTIRCLSSYSLGQKNYLGGFFKQIDKTSQKKLERFIIKQERELLRNEKDDC